MRPPMFAWLLLSAAALAACARQDAPPAPAAAARTAAATVAEAEPDADPDAQRLADAVAAQFPAIPSIVVPEIVGVTFADGYSLALHSALVTCGGLLVASAHFINLRTHRAVHVHGPSCAH